MVYLIFLLKV